MDLESLDQVILLESEVSLIPDVPDTKVDSYFEFCPDVLKFLKDEHMNVCIAAGKHDPRTIVTALHDGGASRVSGAFSIHHKPSVMAYFGRRPHYYLVLNTVSPSFYSNRTWSYGCY